MDQEHLVICLHDSHIVFRRPSAFGGDLLASLRASETSLLNLLRGARDNFSIEPELREVYQAVVPGGSPLATFDSMSRQIATAVSQGIVRAFVVPLVTAATGTAAAAAAPAADTAVPFVDDNGAPVLDPTGTPMQRPIGLDPHVIVSQGISDKKVEEEMILYGGGTTAAGYQLGALAKFKQGGEWDAQRIGGRFHSEFVDYATVLIGLYAAATGMPQAGILTIENDFAAIKSRYPPGTVMDNTYTHLPVRNVVNTATGYQLYSTGRIRPAAGSP